MLVLVHAGHEDLLEILGAEGLEVLGAEGLVVLGAGVVIVDVGEHLGLLVSRYLVSVVRGLWIISRMHRDTDRIDDFRLS